MHSTKKLLGDLLRQTLVILCGLVLCAGSGIALYFIYSPHTFAPDNFVQNNPWAVVFIIPAAMGLSLLMFVLIMILGTILVTGAFILIWGVYAWELPWYGTIKLDKMRAENPQDLPLEHSGKRTALALCSVLLLVSGVSWGVWAYSVQLSNEPIGGPGDPAILYTNVPSIGDHDDLQGQALHIKAGDYRVAVFIKVGGVWWTKPTFAQPTVTIQTGGLWVCDITTGGETDLAATEIAAYLVPAGYSPPVMSGQSSTLPADLLENSVANCTQIRIAATNYR